MGLWHPSHDLQLSRASRIHLPHGGQCGLSTLSPDSGQVPAFGSSPQLPPGHGHLHQPHPSPARFHFPLHRTGEPKSKSFAFPGPSPLQDKGQELRSEEHFSPWGWQVGQVIWCSGGRTAMGGCAGCALHRGFRLKPSQTPPAEPWALAHTASAQGRWPFFSFLQGHLLLGKGARLSPCASPSQVL